MIWQNTTIYQGSARTITVHLRSKMTGRPFDLTGVSAIVAQFRGLNEVVELTLAADTIAVVSPAGSGVLNLSLSEAFIDSLRTERNMTFDIIVTKNGLPTVIRFREALNVEKALCDC